MSCKADTETPDAPLFQDLELWDDQIPKKPALQMALDEALLAALRRPLLRHYRWEGKVASFGVSQSASSAAQEAPGFELVRRWTGGGVVRHDADWTFSLLVPGEEPFSKLRPSASYPALHRRIARALSAWAPRLAEERDCRQTPACFTGSSLNDLLDRKGSKICGGAQRRTRCGLLHQGSIQGLPLPEDFADLLASAMAHRVHPHSPDQETQTTASHLALAKYASPIWKNRIP